MDSGKERIARSHLECISYALNSTEDNQFKPFDDMWDGKNSASRSPVQAVVRGAKKATNGMKRPPSINDRHNN